MNEAEKYAKKLELYPDEHSFCACSHGFIFQDGSTLDIGEHMDHAVLPRRHWKRLRIITYYYSRMDISLNVRLYGVPTPGQRRSLKDCIIGFGNLGDIYYDFYEKGIATRSGRVASYDWLMMEIQGGD